MENSSPLRTSFTTPAQLMMQVSTMTAAAMRRERRSMAVSSTRSGAVDSSGTTRSKNAALSSAIMVGEKAQSSSFMISWVVMLIMLITAMDSQLRTDIRLAMRTKPLIRQNVTSAYPATNPARPRISLVSTWVVRAAYSAAELLVQGPAVRSL